MAAICNFIRLNQMNITMRVFFLLALVLQFSLLASSQPLIIAHRGSSFIAPENTLSAAKLAWEQNADAVECDIYLTKDKRVMVMHDGDTKRTTGQSHKFAETNSDVLRTLDAGTLKNARYQGERIPFLEELIATVPQGKKLVIEIKCGQEVFPFLKKIVKSSGKKTQLVFIAFDWETIVKAKSLFPRNACYWLSSSATSVEQKLPEIRKNKLDGINLNNKIINQDLMTKAQKAGIPVLSWTVDDPAEAKRLVQLGVSAITTNRPDLIRESLQ